VLVGRDRERLALGSLLAAARLGDSRVLVLRGEPGIGKTALLDEAESLAEDMRPLRAQGVESEQYVPFAGLLQLLRPLLPLLDQIPVPQAHALSAALMLAPPDDPDRTTEPSRFAVGAATLSLLSHAADDVPVVVLVDDAHLLDHPSAEALVFAARRLVSDPVALLACARPEEPGAAVWASLPGLDLHGLDLEAARQLLESGPSPVRRDQLARLHTATAGNPLALLELGGRPRGVEAVPADSPVALSQQLSDAFLGRAGALSDATREALLVASADSTSATTVYAACRVLGLAGSGLTEAEDAGLVALHGDSVTFRHPLVRSAVYGAADPRRRREVHRALADVVPREEIDRLAWHLAEGAEGPDETTAGVLDAVALQASARGAYAIAANALERAVGLTVEDSRLPRRLAGAGQAAWMAGSTAQAIAFLDRALGSRPDALLRAHVQELRGAVETRCGSMEVALGLLEHAAEEVRATDPATAIRLWADTIHVCFYLADPGAAMRAAGSIDELTPEVEDPYVRSLASMATGMALILGGAGAEGTERIRAAAYDLVSAEEASDRFRLPLRVQGALWLREAGPSRTLLSDTVARLRDEAALGSLPYLLMQIGRDAATTDRWDQAESAYGESIRLARETGQTTDLGMSLGGLALVHARRGQAEACQEMVDAGLEMCMRNQVRIAAVWHRFALGDLAFGLGDLATAVEQYRTLDVVLATAGMADPDQSSGAELTEALVHLGRDEEARAAADALWRKAAAKAQPWSEARARRALALCASDDTAEALYLEALELHARTPDGYEAARTKLAFGSWLRRVRRRSDARPLLREALATFESLGAAPFADRAAQELQATGETARRREVTTTEELTPQERQIAQLLAEGRTTREAAAALFLSPKTVEYHLRHVYIKLGIRSRAALAEHFGSG